MENQKHIAIIIPAYNAEKYLADCLDSVIAQTYQNWEAFCMNDGSRDNTFAILSAYALKDKRIHIFTHGNCGVTKTRNKLLDKVPPQTDFLYFMDADDFIHPMTLQIALHFACKTKADITEFGFTRTAADSSLPSFTKISLADISFTQISDKHSLLINKKQTGQWYSCWNKLFRYSVVKSVRFNEKLSYEDDVLYNMQANAQADNKIILNIPLYYWRKNPHSITGTPDFKKYTECAIERISFCNRYFIKENHIPENIKADFIKDLTSDTYRMIVRKALKNCPDKALRKQLFLLSSQAVNRFVKEGCIDIKSLSFAKRQAISFCLQGKYLPTRIAVLIASCL